MKKINNKGFTLIEVLAVIAIIAVLGLIAVPSILNTINTSKDATYDILVDEIKVAGKQLFEEVEYTNNDLCHYNQDGQLEGCLDKTYPNDNWKIKITVSNDSNGNEIKVIKVNLQTLVSNGFLNGTNNDNESSGNKNSKIILTPKTKEDIGNCSIRITKTVTGTNYKTSYKIEDANTTAIEICPTTEDYNK